MRFIMNNPLNLEKGGLFQFVKRFTKEIIIAFVFAIAAGVFIEWWIERSRTQAIENNLKAIATIMVYNKDQKPISQGSGIFINSSGLLATNAHVIAVRGLSNITAQLSSGACYFIREIKSIDQDRDIAILQFDARETPSVTGIGNSDDISVGQKIYAMGTPMGQEGTVSIGNISSINKEINGNKFIQFTAPISPGSSGGGLFTDNGEVIGITSNTLNINSGPQSGLAQNINFAVPINDVKTSIKGGKNLSQGSAAYNYAQGMIALDQKELDTAIKFFKKAVEINNNYAEAYIGLAGIYYDKGNYVQEVQYCLLATEADSTKTDPFYWLGTAYEDVGQYHNAIKAYNKALELEPDNKDALHDLAILYIALGNKTLASETISKLKETDPGLATKVQLLLGK
jgi:S1-C subfamily serine protease